MLHVEAISKSFPGVRALSEVSLAFEPGTVHAVVGENGAGKSTLIKVICGIYQPDEGTITLDGNELALHAYGDAMAQGIQLVSQEIQVIPKSTVAENIMLDKLERYAERSAIDWKRLHRDAEPAACPPRRSSSS
jgi:ABC-type sugar transport system ATPase subunit